jgi:hypothetical protein
VLILRVWVCTHIFLFPPQALSRRENTVLHAITYNKEYGQGLSGTVKLQASYLR